MTCLYILTGASRGLGAEIARQLLLRDSELLGLSRTRNPALKRLASESGRRMEQWPVDLSDPLPVAQRLGEWLTERGAAGLDGLTLINNAALLETPGPFEQQDPRMISSALRVGLEAPLLLTQAFLAASAGFGLPRRVLNISSGLGRRPLAGLATYCSSKAGLDHFSRTLAEELSTQALPAKVCSLAPGIVDTGMQVQLREADGSAFAAQPVFADFKQSGALDSAEQAAAKILAVLDHSDFGSEPVSDVRA